MKSGFCIALLFLILGLPSLAVSGELRLLELPPLYVGEEKGLSLDPFFEGKKVIYYDAKQRAKQQLFMRNGKLITPDQRLFDTREGAVIRSPDRSRPVWHTAIIVLDEQDHLRFSLTPLRTIIHHSSLTAGKPVKFAGEIEVRNGVIVGVTNSSGHYNPTLEHLFAFLNHLEGQGVDLSQAKVRAEEASVLKFLSKKKHEPETIKDFMRYSLEQLFTVANRQAPHLWITLHADHLQHHLDSESFFRALNSMEGQASTELQRALLPWMQKLPPSVWENPENMAILKNKMGEGIARRMQHPRRPFLNAVCDVSLFLRGFVSKR